MSATDGKGRPVCRECSEGRHADCTGDFGGVGADRALTCYCPYCRAWIDKHGPFSIPENETAPIETSDNRFVRVRCPICNAISPVCDQTEDIRRDLLFRWWAAHRDTHLPLPIIERAETTDAK